MAAAVGLMKSELVEDFSMCTMNIFMTLSWHFGCKRCRVSVYLYLGHLLVCVFRYAAKLYFNLC